MRFNPSGGGRCRPSSSARHAVDKSVQSRILARSGSHGTDGRLVHCGTSPPRSRFQFPARPPSAVVFFVCAPHALAARAGMHHPAACLFRVDIRSPPLPLQDRQHWHSPFSHREIVFCGRRIPAVARLSGASVCCSYPGTPANCLSSRGGVLLRLLLAMAASSMLSDMGGHRNTSGGASRPPLPRPEGDNVRPVPLWEREFCHNAYDIPWETFCRNKWFIGLYKKVMDWDDSEALNNFLDSKERFRAKYHGEPYEEPVLDPDMYIDEVDHNSNVHQQGVDPFHTSSGSARMLSSGIWIGGTSVGGARNWNVGGGGSSSGGRTNWNGGSGSGGNNGSGRNRKSGGGGGSNKNGGGGRGRGINWNCFGPCNRGNQAEGQHQKRDSGGMQRNQNEVQQQQRSGIRQQQSQRGTKWRLVPPPKDDPFA